MHTQTQFRFTAAQFRGKLATIDVAADVARCSVDVGMHGYGADFLVPKLHIEGDRAGLCSLGWLCLKAIFGADDKLEVPLAPDSWLSLVRVSAVRPSEYCEVHEIRSFAYAAKKQPIGPHPWYPASQRWDPYESLPGFGLDGVPQGIPHIATIDGHPRALARLARVFLDVGNVGARDDDCRLEVEGGFRGVGPLSYEASITRSDSFVARCRNPNCQPVKARIPVWMTSQDFTGRRLG